MKKVIATVMLSLLLSGCAREAAPNYFNGNYYMAGDENCTRIQQLTPDRVMCMNADGVATGYRDAMTPTDMQMYRMQRMQSQMQMAQLGQQLQQTGQSFQQSGQRIQQQSQSWSAPQVQSYSYGSGTTSYSQVGNSLVGSDGTACHYVGSTVICR